MIHDLLEILDRSWTALADERGLDFALNCFPFYAQLQRDARTNSVLGDLRGEERRSLEALRSAENAARGELLAVVDTLAAEAQGVFEPPPDDEWDYDTSIEAIRGRLTPPQRNADDEAWAMGRESDEDDHIGEAIAIIRAATERTQRDDLRQRVDETRRALEHARRIRRTFFRTSAASALVRMERDLEDLHPPPTDPGLRADLSRMARTRQRPMGRIFDALFGNADRISDDDDSGVAEQLTQMRANARRIYEEVRRRLGAERSLLAVFDRYRQRCQWYEVERLQAIAADARGKVEDRLTETLATYLFEHGLNPLTRPLAGLLQPDLLGHDARFSFYVEAKQYSASARGYLVAGMHQIWDMLGQLRGSRFDVTEAFYVVYRLGGPRYSLPARLQHDDRIVHLIMIDIAPTSERGSRAPRTEAIDAADLLPQPSKSS